MRPSSERRRVAGGSLPVLPIQAASGRALRVLLVTDEMEVGGTQRQIVNLAVALQRRGVETTVLYFRHPSFLVDELQRAGVRVVHCPKRSAVDLGFLCALAHRIRSGQHDVAHAFAFSAELWTALALALAVGGRRPALISSVRGTYDWYARWQWQVKRWVSARSAAVVANSQQGGRYAVERTGMASDRLQIVYNGVQVAGVSEVERERALRTWPAMDVAGPAAATAPRALRALFVGRLVDVKSLDTLIEAVAMLPRASLSVAICGDGPLRQRLQRLAQDGEVDDRIVFLGERRDAAALMAAADVLVLPSRQEGLSNALLEAMAAGCAVVASRVGGNVELVQDGHTGLLFPAGEAPALARALLSLHQDPDLRERLGRAARAFVDDRFSVGRMVDDVHRLYLTATGRAQPPSRLSTPREAPVQALGQPSTNLKHRPR
jgi:glycosyltransferase involved in cell wall biosynthesis